MVVQEIHRRIKMKDMLETLRKAKRKKVFIDQQEFKNVLTQIQLADSELKLDSTFKSFIGQIGQLARIYYGLY